MTYQDLELKIIRWAEARKIIPNATLLAQSIKTCEEAHELLDSAHSGNKEAYKDALGDVFVTLVIGSALADIPLTECIEHAYNQIKDRTGHLTPEGIFVKDVK